MPNNAAPPIETGTDCASATRAELDSMNALASPEGQACMALAAAVDSGRALMAVPAMVKELRATLGDLRARTPVEADNVDDIAERRRARRAAAGF